MRGAALACKAAWVAAAAAAPLAGGCVRTAWGSGLPPGEERELPLPEAGAWAGMRTGPTRAQVEMARLAGAVEEAMKKGRESRERELERKAAARAEAEARELELLAAIVYAEAHTEDFDGKRLVADVALNRVDGAGFPDSLEEVVSQEGQFQTWGSGAARRALRLGLAGEEEHAAAMLEMHGVSGRLDPDVLYFRTGRYHDAGTPAYRHGAHYFSTG